MSEALFSIDFEPLMIEPRRLGCPVAGKYQRMPNLHDAEGTKVRDLCIRQSIAALLVATKRK